MNQHINILNMYVIFTKYDPDDSMYQCKLYDIDANKVFNNSTFSIEFIEELNLIEVKDQNIKTKMSLRGIL